MSQIKYHSVRVNTDRFTVISDLEKVTTTKGADKKFF